MDHLDTVLAIVASVVTIGGGIIGVLQYLERAKWRKNRGQSSLVIGAIMLAVLAVVAGSAFAVLQKGQRPDPVVTASGCARLAQFAGATSPALGTAFAGVAFVPESLAGGADTFEVYNYQFEILHVCTTSLSGTDAGQVAAAVHNYYVAQMPAQGWTPTAVFPLDGDAAHPCGEGQDTTGGDTDAVCWSQDSRFVSLQGITVIPGSTTTSAPAVVTYTLWLAIAPQTSAGPVTIPRNSTYAFEPQSVDAGDIQWLQRGTAARTLGPLDGATLANVGAVNFTSLAASDLKNLPFGSDALSAGSGGALAVGDVFGVFTTNHHYVKCEVVGEASGLQIQWVLYPYLMD